MTSPGPDPAPFADSPPTHSVGPWPEHFRGIGGHLIRPRAKPPTPPEPTAPPVPVSFDWLTGHESHLLAPIVANDDGSRTATCPVCVTAAPVPTGGWVNVRCSACGTDFIASDGSPPPVIAPPPVPPPPTAPVAPSPLAPPPVLWGPLPTEPQGFTDDVYIDPTGRRFVICPQCHSAEVDIPEDAWVAELVRCPACNNSILVNLGREPKPTGPPEPPPPPPIYDPYGKMWSKCPNCGLAALTPDRTDHERALVCTVCRQRIIVSKGRRPPRPLALPAPLGAWERFWRWFFGG